MNTLSTQAPAALSTPWRPVGEVTVASPFMDPAKSLGPFGRDPVRDFRLAQDARLPAFQGDTTGDLDEYCSRYGLVLGKHTPAGRVAAASRYMAWYHFLIFAEVS